VFQHCAQQDAAVFHFHVGVDLGHPFVQPRGKIDSRMAHERMDILMNRCTGTQLFEIAHHDEIALLVADVIRRGERLRTERLVLALGIEADESNWRLRIELGMPGAKEEVARLFEGSEYDARLVLAGGGIEDEVEGSDFDPVSGKEDRRRDREDEDACSQVHSNDSYSFG